MCFKVRWEARLNRVAEAGAGAVEVHAGRLRRVKARERKCLG